MNQFLQTLGESNKRILTVALALSMVLLSLSGLIYSLQSAYAQPVRAAPVTQGMVGVGCDGQYVYYFRADGQLRKVLKGIATEY